MTTERSLNRLHRVVSRPVAIIDPLQLRASDTAAIGQFGESDASRRERGIKASEGFPLDHEAHYKPQKCGTSSPFLEARRNYAATPKNLSMDTRQQPIAEWMREVMARRSMTARGWADKAGLGKDTVSRAIRDDYANVTSSRTIGKLADAIDERPPGAAGSVPSAESLEAILVTILAAAKEAPPGPASMRVLASSLRETLLGLLDEPVGSNDPALSRALVRSSIRRNGLPASRH